MKGTILGIILIIAGLVLGTNAITNPLGSTYRGEISFNNLNEYFAFSELVNSLPKVDPFTNDLLITGISKPARENE